MGRRSPCCATCIGAGVTESQGLAWPDVLHGRLARGVLSPPAPADRLVEVVRAVGGLQAQVMSAAELALAARVSGIVQADVQAALWQQRSLVKTYGPRGTLHLLPAGELPLWMAALGQRGLYGWQERGIDPAHGAVLAGHIADALDGRSLTRAELADEVARRAGAALRERIASTWADLIVPAAFAGALCFGPSHGAQVTFVRPDQWLGGWHAPDPDAAVAEICRRFLRTYGPATHGDFARWFGMAPPQARELFAALADELQAVEVEGHRAWLLAGDVPPVTPGSSSVLLLPQYDCYILGSHPRTVLIPEDVRARIATYGRGRFEGAVGVPVLVVDGRVSGIWERKRRGRRLDLRVEPIVPLTPDQQHMLEVEAARIGAFIGLETTLAIEPLD